MSSTNRIVLRRKTGAKSLACYYCLAISSIVALYLFGRFIGFIPPFVIAFIWAIASAFSGVAFAYPSIIKKYNTKEMFLDGSEASRYINGRWARLTLSFFLSAILMASLMIESQAWSITEWVIVFVFVLLYPFISDIITRLKVRKLYEPAYQRRGTILWSWAIGGIALTIIFFGFKLATYSNDALTFGESFSVSKQLFLNSNSALMSEIGKIGYLTNALTAYGLSQVSVFANPLYWLICLILCASTSLGLAHILCLCSLRKPELKKVFLPIGETTNQHFRNKIINKNRWTVACLVVLLVILFTVGEVFAGAAQQTNEYTKIDIFVRNNANIVTYEIDDKQYDRDTVDVAVDHVLQSNSEFADARTAVIQEINASYDSCKARVDEYINWLFVIGPMKRPFINEEQEYWNRITCDVDFQKLRECVQNYNDVIDSQRPKVREELSKMERFEIPSWIIKEKKSFHAYPRLMHFESEFSWHLPEGDTGNREAYRKAAYEAIQDSRAEMLALVQ